MFGSNNYECVLGTEAKQRIQYMYKSLYISIKATTITSSFHKSLAVGAAAMPLHLIVSLVFNCPMVASERHVS